MSDLIKRSDAIKDLCDISNNSDMPEDWHKGLSVAISALYRVPSADRPQGEWVDTTSGEHYKCSVCGYRAPMVWEDFEEVEWLSDFCPHCGADMRSKIVGKHADFMMIDEACAKGADDETD